MGRFDSRRALISVGIPSGRLESEPPPGACRGTCRAAESGANFPLPAIQASVAQLRPSETGLSIFLYSGFLVSAGKPRMNLARASWSGGGGGPENEDENEDRHTPRQYFVSVRMLHTLSVFCFAFNCVPPEPVLATQEKRRSKRGCRDEIERR